jgi:hypothetical protein
MGMQPRSPSVSQVIARDPFGYGGPRVGTSPSSLPSVDLSRYTDPLGSLSQYQRISEGIKNVQARPAKIEDRVPTESFASPQTPAPAPGMNYSSPLRPGSTPEDMALRNSLMNKYEQEIRDIMRGDPVSTGNPNMAGNPPAGQGRKENPLAGTGYGTFNIAGVDRIMAAPENLPPEKTPTEPRDRSFSNSFISSAAAETPGSVDLRGAGYGTFNVPKSAGIDAELGKIEKELDAPPVKEMKDMTVEEMIRALRPSGKKEDGPFPDAIFRRQAAKTYTSPYDIPAANTDVDDSLGPQTYTSVQGGLGMSPFNAMPREDRLVTTGPAAKNFSGKGLKASTRDDRYYGGSWRSDSDADVGGPTDEVYGPKNVDPKVQELMKDIEKKNKYGTKIAKSAPIVGPAFRLGDSLRDLFTGKNTAEADADLKRAYMQGSPAQQAELEAKYPNLTKFAQQAGLEPRLPMSNYENWRQRSFGTGGGMGGSTSTTSSGGGITDIGSGGKNEPPRIEQAEKEATKPKPKPKEDGRRPAIYYKWDLGVGVPSPTDSDYTLYLKYLQEKDAAKAGFA